MSTTTTHSRAKAGGEFGANGEWYEGGKFINTVAENAKRCGSTPNRSTRKQEIEPYKWEVAPEGKMSLFRQLSGIEFFNRASLQFSFNTGLRLDYATPSAIERRKTMIAAFNAGERWV